MAGLQKNETGSIHESSGVAGRASQGNHDCSADPSRTIISFFKKQTQNDSPSEKRQTTIKKFFKKQQGGNMATKQTRFVRVKTTVLKLGSADEAQQDIKKPTVGGDGSSNHHQADTSTPKPNKMNPTFVEDVQKNCGPSRACVSAIWSGGMPMMMDGGNRQINRSYAEGFGCESPSPRPTLRRSERLGSGSFGLSPTTTEEFPGDDFETSPCQASPAASSMTNRQPSSAAESLPASNAKSQ